MASAEPRRIEWDSAEIEDGELTVELSGSPSKVWKAHFEAVLSLLDTPNRTWGEVRITKKGIKVADLQQGREAELHHFLESVVLQANAATAPDSSQDEDRSEVAREPDPDAQMTATFRGFAAED